MNQIEFRGVSRVFHHAARAPQLAVSVPELTIRPGEFVCLVGPSGCGKSTLLNMTTGLLPPSTGTVYYNGQPVTEINHRVGYVTQKDTLLEWRTAERNVALPLELQRVPRAERSRRVAEVLELVGLNGFEKYYPAELSGGMRKRVLLAQALVYRPETLLMDEPFGALDAQLRLSMQSQLLDIWGTHQKTVLFVTHDLEEAILMADRVVVFSASPGRIIHIEDVQFSRPRNLPDLRGNPQYHEIWDRLWTLLAPEMTQARSE